MPVTRSDLMIFLGGAAAGAAAIATYPRWKDKVDPLLSSALAGVAAAYREASTAAGEAAEASSDASDESQPGRPQTATVATVPFSA